METLAVVLVSLTGLVSSLILNNHLKKIPLPFIYILMGMMFSFLPIFHKFILNPELFIIMLIAPLLYGEAQHASRYWIGRGMVNIFSLAIALVIVTVIMVGYSVHLVFPIIPLALGMALAAIVTPTDASAVSAFSYDNPKFHKASIILQNESLFNDAAGFVMFDLAVLMFYKGNFPILNGSKTFLQEFLGGLIAGAILGFIIHRLKAILISRKDNLPVVMLAIEYITPFLVYFIASETHLSGILAVVAAGLVQGVENDRLQLLASEFQLIRSNIWSLLEQIMSGTIFFLLGLSLIGIILKITHVNQGLILKLIFIGLFIYLLKLVIRILWTRYLLVGTKTNETSKWNNALLMGFSGASGTISLSLALLFPNGISDGAVTTRDTLIFIVTVVIIISLIVSAIIIPQMTKLPVNHEKTIHQFRREIIMLTINNFKLHKSQFAAEEQMVVDALQDQLYNHRNKIGDYKLNRLYHEAAKVELAAVKTLYDEGKITHTEFIYYRKFVDYSVMTVQNNPFRNIFMRFKYGSNIRDLTQSIQDFQDVTLTSTLIATQCYWKQLFNEHHDNITLMEETGLKAVKKYISMQKKFQKYDRSYLYQLSKYYRQRHRRITMEVPNSERLYKQFLTAFEDEIYFLQQKLDKNELSIKMANELRKQILYDELTYMKNAERFDK